MFYFLKILSYSILFIICFFIDYNQFTYWLSLSIPIIFFFPKNYISTKNIFFKLFKILLSITIIQLIGYCFIFNYNNYLVKRTLTFSLIVVNVFLLYNFLNNKKYFELFTSFIVGSFIFSLIVLFEINFDLNLISDSKIIGKNIFGSLVFTTICVIILNKIYFSNLVWIMLIFWFFIILIFSGSLKFIIPTIIIFLYYFIIYSKYNLKYLLIIPALFFLSEIQFFVESNLSLKVGYSRILSLFFLEEYSYYDFNNPIDTRGNLLKSGFNIFLENPFFGIGLEESRNIMFTYTHNTYLEFLVGGGLFLFLPFFLATTVPLIYFIKNKNWLLTLMYISILIIAQFQRIYDNQILFFLITFLFISIERQKRFTDN